MKEYTFILASASPRRREMLMNMGLKFIIKIPDIHESPRKHESPVEYVKRNAREKAERVISSKMLKIGESPGNKSPTIVLAADTVVVYKKQILEKPSSRQHAVTMLSAISGKKHNVFTGFTVIVSDPRSKKTKIVTKAVESSVWLRKMTKSEIIAYVNTKEPMDKAGSYAIQGIGATIVRKIEGSYTNVVGLPVFEVFSVLGSMGITLF